MLEAMGEPRYRGRQIYRGLYVRKVNTFNDITDLKAETRLKLAKQFTLNRPTLDDLQISTDGTRKYRFVTKTEGTAFESVYIPRVGKTGKSHTLCVSSQTGCAVGCTFCYTASLRRNRNLAASEILGQVLAVHNDLSAPKSGEPQSITNIVFMGMGEPLLNYNEVVRSARLLVDPSGLAFSTRRVTISTAGIVPRIKTLGHDVDTQLAISLNATTDEVRNRIMPINKKWPIEQLIGALKEYPLKHRRRFTIEYVLLGGINDSIDDARRLVRLLGNLPVKVNLLPLNAHDRTEFTPPSQHDAQAFADELHHRHVNTSLRTPRGQDIAAACGQLGETMVTPNT